MQALEESLAKAGVSDFAAYLDISDASLGDLFTRIEAVENRISNLETTAAGFNGVPLHEAGAKNDQKICGDTFENDHPAAPSGRQLSPERKEGRKESSFL